jgi:hypothetical protein
MNGRFVTVLVLIAALSMTLASVAFAQGGKDKQKFRAQLEPLNGSGASGHAKLTLEGNKLNAKINSHGLAPNLPHAQHIHGFEQAVSECPSLAADDDGDGLVNTLEGLPSYGPILLSFTTTGDTSPSSGLAVDRFPPANPGGSVNYKRTIAVSSEIANKLGMFHVVQHGVDLNGNGKYDFEAAGPSELDPSLPQEATIPANCGVIEPMAPGLHK